MSRNLDGLWAASVGALLALAAATAGCPGPKTPAQPEPTDLSDDVDMEPLPTEPAEEAPPPEAGVVALGPALMTGGAGMSDEARADAKQAFLSAFEQGKHHFRRCYAPALERSAELAGSIDVEVVLNADGSIYELKVPSKELDDEQMVRCVLRAFRKLDYAPLRDGELFSVTPVVKFEPE